MLLRILKLFVVALVVVYSGIVAVAVAVVEKMSKR